MRITWIYTQLDVFILIAVHFGRHLLCKILIYSAQISLICIKKFHLLVLFEDNWYSLIWPPVIVVRKPTVKLKIYFI